MNNDERQNNNTQTIGVSVKQDKQIKVIKQRLLFAFWQIKLVKKATQNK